MKGIGAKEQPGQTMDGELVVSEIARCGYSFTSNGQVKILRKVELSQQGRKRNEKQAIGIDLGTTFSAMATINAAGKPEIVRIKRQDYRICRVLSAR